MRIYTTTEIAKYLKIKQYLIRYIANKFSFGFHIEYTWRFTEQQLNRLEKIIETARDNKIVHRKKRIEIHYKEQSG